MMTKTDTSKPVQSDLFKVMLRDLVAKGHELVLLRDAIDWQRYEKVLEPAYCSDNGRPSIPVRMMAGLTFLKYMFGLSDQDVLDNWCENPYWQYFCGGEFFEHEPPTDQETMSRWRSRAGETGVREMITETIASALRNKVAKKKDFERVNVDTTVQEKNVRFHTDARTLDRAVHEPQVECITKGKVHKRYEFGVKAGYVTASRTNWVPGAMALPGNPYDGNTLAQAEDVCGVKPQHTCCDLGYRGHGYKGECDVQVLNRFSKRKPMGVLRWWKRRSAIEPVIGHIKSDHYMERNMLGGELGDKLNAMLSAVGFNLVKLMKGLKKKWLKSLFLCLREVTDGMARIIAGLRDQFMPPTVSERLAAGGVACRHPRFGNWAFA